MAQLQFNAANVAPAEAMEAIPAGWYIAQMVASEMKPTSNGRGAFLSCEYQILEGTYKGRKLFDRINLQNANPTAVEIGYRQLSAICHAVGVIQIDDSSLLHNRPLGIKVSMRPAGPGADGNHYEASNEVKGYKAANAVQQAAPAATAPAHFAPPPQQFAPPLAQQFNQQQPQQFAPQPQQQFNQQQPQQFAPQPQQQQWPQQQPAQFAPQQQPLPQGAGYAPAFQQPAQQPAQQEGMPAWANAQPVAPAAQPQQQQQAPAQTAQQAPAPMPPWAGQPAPAPQPTEAAAPQQQPAQGGTPTPPWATQPQQ